MIAAGNGGLGRVCHSRHAYAQRCTLRSTKFREDFGWRRRTLDSSSEDCLMEGGEYSDFRFRNTVQSGTHAWDTGMPFMRPSDDEGDSEGGPLAGRNWVCRCPCPVASGCDVLLFVRGLGGSSGQNFNSGPCYLTPRSLRIDTAEGIVGRRSVVVCMQRRGFGARMRCDAAISLRRCSRAQYRAICGEFEA